MFDLKDSLGEFFTTYSIQTYAEDSHAVERSIRLIKEESHEVRIALDEYRRSGSLDDLAHAAKELADDIYVAAYAAHAIDVDIRPILAAVHESNLAKRWDDGEIHRDEHGKILKPPNWQPPDIVALILDQVVAIEDAA